MLVNVVYLSAPWSNRLYMWVTFEKVIEVYDGPVADRHTGIRIDIFAQLPVIEHGGLHVSSAEQALHLEEVNFFGHFTPKICRVGSRRRKPLLITQVADRE